MLSMLYCPPLESFCFSDGVKRSGGYITLNSAYQHRIYRTQDLESSRIVIIPKGLTEWMD